MRIVFMLYLMRMLFDLIAACEGGDMIRLVQRVSPLLDHF